MLSPQRGEVLRALVQRLRRRDRSRPFRLGVDGPCGAGKTRFGRDLAAALEEAGEPVLRLDSDAFHHLGPRRRRRTDDPARGYYDDAYDLDGLAENVLEPAGAGDTTLVATLCDFAADRLHRTTVTTQRDAVVVMECTFLQRGRLRDLWDLLVYLDVPDDVALTRAIARDAAALGGTEVAREAHERRYAAAWALYRAEQAPMDRADVVVDHSDPQAPRIVRA